MEESYKAKLKINQKQIPMNHFVEEFLSRTTVGAITSLRGAENIRKLEIHQKKGNVEITVNGNDIPLTPFPNDIISNTLLGMVSSLKDVEDIDSIDISVEAVTTAL
ncbi:MAG: hypothetical protein MUO89_03510 [Dehalococcoidia bacterium]|nr:hypothetical protein [Dehalococcoidia bacterium]